MGVGERLEGECLPLVRQLWPPEDFLARVFIAFEVPGKAHQEESPAKLAHSGGDVKGIEEIKEFVLLSFSCTCYNLRLP